MGFPPSPVMLYQYWLGGVTEKSVGSKKCWDPNNPATATTVLFFFKVSSVDEMPNHPWNYNIFKWTIFGPLRMKKWNPSKFTLCFLGSPEILKDILNLHRGSPENSNLWPSTCVSAVQVLLWQADAQTLPQDGWFVKGYEGIHCWLNAKAASLLQIWRSHITRL